MSIKNYPGFLVDDEKLFTALMTLRDNSRVGFMVAYARLVQLALASETPLALKAQYCLVAYQNPKYKSKMTQVKHSFSLGKINFILAIYHCQLRRFTSRCILRRRRLSIRSK